MNLYVIINRIIEEKFNIKEMKQILLSKEKAEGFYDIHRERPFFDDLTDFMSSGICIVMALEKVDAVNQWRNLIGATNPDQAADGTIRKDFASSLGENAVHGADSDENANREIGFFFSNVELIANH